MIYFKKNPKYSVLSNLRIVFNETHRGKKNSSIIHLPLNIISIEADCWMAGQCWMTMSPNNIRLEVKTLISFISCHPTILVYKLKY